MNGLYFFLKIYPESKEHLLYKNLALVNQYTYPLQYNWNKLYQISALSPFFFQYVDSLMNKHPDLKKIQLIAPNGQILFDSDELFYGRYELLKPRIIQDSLIRASLTVDHGLYYYRRMNMLSGDTFKEGLYIDYLNPIYDNLMGKIGYVRFIFSTDSLRKNLLTKLAYQILFMALWMLFFVIAFYSLRHYRNAFFKILRDFLPVLNPETDELSELETKDEQKIMNISRRLLENTRKEIENFDSKRQLLAENLPFPFVVIGTDGTILECNQLFYNYFPSARKIRRLQDLTDEADWQFERLASLPYEKTESFPVLLKRNRKKLTFFTRKIQYPDKKSVVLGFLLDSGLFAQQKPLQDIIPYQVLELFAREHNLSLFLINEENKIIYSVGELVEYLVRQGHNPIMDDIFQLLPELDHARSLIGRLKNQTDVKKIKFDLQIKLIDNKWNSHCSVYKLNSGNIPLLLVSIYRHYQTGMESTPAPLATLDMFIRTVGQMNAILYSLARSTPPVTNESSGKHDGEKSNEITEFFGQLLQFQEKIARLNKLSFISSQENLFSDKINIFEFLNNEIKSRYRDVEFFIHGKKELTFNLTRKVLSFILEELVNNAIQATPSGQKTIVEISYQLVPDPMQHSGYAVQIRIKDHGKGIPLHLQHKIFEPFVSLNKEKPFAGVGLYLVKNILQLCNGSIAFKSSENTGTSFYIILPYLTSGESFK